MADDMDFEKGEGAEKISELVEISKFKGRPVLVLRKTVDDQYPFSFGVGKAKLILDNMQVIEDFVAKHGK